MTAFPRAESFVDSSLVDRFREQVRRRADFPAIDDGARVVSYRELGAEVRTAAHVLRTITGGAPARVVLFARQGIDAVVATLAVLSAGSAYVPLDGTLSADTLREMIRSADPAVIVAEPEFLEIAGQVKPAEVPLLLPADLRRATAPDADEPPLPPDTIAYIYYTSGSTGKPKGVYDSHRNVLHNIWRYTSLLEIDARDRLTLLQSPPFSGTVSSLFAALLNGAVCLPYDVRTRGLSALGRWLKDHRATIFHSVPAIFREAFADGAPPELRCIRLEGDQASRRDLEIFQRVCHPGTILANGLGATECGLVRQWRITPGTPWPEGPIPIGTAVPDMDIVLLADDGSEVAPGGIGQIAVRSAYLALGYWRQPELTAARFGLPGGDPARRTYLTGDLGRLLDGDLLQYLGRKDFQARLNGEWIDTEALERALQTGPGVKDVAVTVVPIAEASPELVAYVVLRDGAALEPRRLREHLQRNAPGSRSPTRWCRLDRLPLTENLKVDRRRLPAPPEPTDAGGLVAPRDETERTLLSLWCEVLQRTSLGVDSDFLDSGGDSLRAMKLATRIEAAFGREVSAATLFERGSVAALAEWLRADLRSSAGAPHSESVREDVLSCAEERLRFLHGREDRSPEYHVAQILRVQGSLDRPALERALRRVMARQAALRTRFVDTSDGARRVVDEPAGIVMTELPRVAPGTAEFADALRRERDRPFDLARGPLFRAAWASNGPEEHIVLLTWHHAVTDGLSQGIFHRELAHFYREELGENLPPLPPLRSTYADYARQQRAALASDARLLAEAVGRLKGVPPLDLPLDRARPTRRGTAGAARDFRLAGERAHRLRLRQQAENATAFQVLLGTFAIWLGRWCDQEDFAIGVPVNDRPSLAFEDLVGLFVNTVAWRADLSGEPDFPTVIRRVRLSAPALLAQRGVPFERVVEALNPPREPGRDPIFQVMFALQEPAESAVPVLPGAHVTEWRLPPDTTHFDLELHLTPEADGWRGSLVFRTALFDEAAIDRGTAQFLQLMDALLAHPERSVWRQPLMSEAEHRRCLDLARGTGPASLYPQCIHALVTAQAERTPAAVAVSDGRTALTFQELERESGRLAAHLAALGVGPETTVGVCLERSTFMVVALLGILKSGGAYVPVDAETPPERMALVWGDAEVKAVVTQDSLMPRLNFVAWPRVSLDRAAEWRSAPVRPAEPANAAYVLYTSGTTGRPKGVLVEHRSATHLLLGLKAHLATDATDVGVALGSLAFDISVAELFLPLVTGARLIVGSEAARRDGRVLAHLLEASGATLLQATPTTWRMLLESGWAGRSALRAITGGEPLTPALAEALLPRVRELWNLYGPTETTVYAMGGRIGRADDITIGRPFPGVEIRIEDRRGELRPVGTTGELVIGGEGVARGYRGLPQRTDEQFVLRRDAQQNERRWYRSGDLARWRHDGTVELLGRRDDQVKIRGVRIEMGEVESVLRALPNVRDAAVAVERDAAGDARLVAFVVGREVDANTLRNSVRRDLQRHLPPAMLPSELVVRDALPTTTSGKIDRAALLASRSAQQPVEAPGDFPADSLEANIRRVWQELFPAKAVTAHDDFFESGGHSLLAARLAAGIERQVGLPVSVADVFLFPTIAALAGALRDRPPDHAPWVTLQPTGTLPPLVCVHGWGGGVHGFAPLARALAPHRPVFGLQALALSPAEPLSLAALAERHADELLSRTDGPHHLLGHSAGGWLAFAIARVLAGRGRPPALLAVLDTEPLFRVPFSVHARVQIPFLIRRLGKHLRGWPRMLAGSPVAVVRQKAAAAGAHLQRREKISPNHPDPTVAAVARYQPEPYTGPLVVFTVADTDPRLTTIWRHYARGRLTVQQVGGNHLSCLHPEHAAELALAVEQAIGAVDGRRPLPGPR